MGFSVYPCDDKQNIEKYIAHNLDRDEGRFVRSIASSF